MRSLLSLMAAFWLAVLGTGALAGAPGPLAAVPAPFVPAVIYAIGQKFDKSFNEAAYAGARRFEHGTGAKVLETELTTVAQFEQAVSSLVRHGATDIAAIGFYYATPLGGIAARFPNVRFTLIDGVVDRPNVQSIVFKEHEGSFLVGMLAAMASKTGKVGFVGALDIPLLRKFSTAYQEGVRYVDPQAQTLVNFISTTPAGFNDVTRAAEVTRSQFERGVDVVFAGAGASNIGIFNEAQAAGRLAIGHDSNQNGVIPGTILTTMLKRVDLAVEGTFAAGRDGNWRPGVRQLGLADGGVDYSLDENNRPLVTQAMIERLEAARQDIIAGRLPVTDVTAP